MSSPRRIYLDYNATTPVDPRVREAMLPFLGDRFGNAASIHAHGREAEAAVAEARHQVAALINATDSEITFTSGATESNNMVLKGMIWASRKTGKNRVITTAVEHEAVLNTCQWLEADGFRITYLPVDRTGRVEPSDLEAALDDRTALVTIMLANNEVGTIQPVAEAAAICREHGVPVHTDAAQGCGKIPIDVQALSVGYLSLSAHKFYGPKGIGALYINRRAAEPIPLLHGGHQQSGRRPGTENVPGIVGLGKAAEVARTSLEDEAPRLSTLRNRLQAGLAELDGAVVNGHPTERLPNTLNISFPGVEGESLLLSLDFQGISASSGSACTSGSTDPSHVLMAMSLSAELAQGALRLSLGRWTTDEEITHVLEVLPQILQRLRGSASPASLQA